MLEAMPTLPKRKARVGSWSVVLLVIVLLSLALYLCVARRIDVRFRAEKKACRAGDVSKCLELGLFYEQYADRPGYIDAQFGYVDDAIQFYGRACELGSMVGCDSMGVLVLRRGSDRYTPDDAFDALAKACIGNIRHACTELSNALRDPDEYITNVKPYPPDIQASRMRLTETFAKTCTSGNRRACALYETFEHGAPLPSITSDAGSR